MYDAHLRTRTADRRHVEFRLPVFIAHFPGVTDRTEPTAHEGLITPWRLELRRAVFAVLLAADEPLSVATIIERLRTDQHVDINSRRRAGTSSKRIADLLRHQVSYGRVIRVRRGMYVVDRAALSPATMYRCANWRRIRSGELRGR